jgi:hypothetical protein
MVEQFYFAVTQDTYSVDTVLYLIPYEVLINNLPSWIQIQDSTKCFQFVFASSWQLFIGIDGQSIVAYSFSFDKAQREDWLTNFTEVARA